MSVTIGFEEGVGRLVLTDPPLNLLTRATMARIREGLRELEGRRELRVALLEAEGPHFSAGASVPEHLPPTYEQMIPEFTETILQLLAFPLPVVAGVQGRCLGGGFEVALAADVVVAGEGTRFALPEIQLGVFPPAACALLDERTPWGTAAELLFTGDGLDGRKALTAGLVHRLVADDEIRGAAEEIAERIARGSASALRAAKAAWSAPLRDRWERRLREAERVYLEDLMSTADAMEGLRAFTEKRAPAWRHR
jgi:cyclohexa-1,5-dienecarbonyl-CoA hydratase